MSKNATTLHRWPKFVRNTEAIYTAIVNGHWMGVPVQTISAYFKQT